MEECSSSKNGGRRKERRGHEINSMECSSVGGSKKAHLQLSNSCFAICCAEPLKHHNIVSLLFEQFKKMTLQDAFIYLDPPFRPSPFSPFRLGKYIAPPHLHPPSSCLPFSPSTIRGHCPLPPHQKTTDPMAYFFPNCAWNTWWNLDSLTTVRHK